MLTYNLTSKPYHNLPILLRLISCNLWHVYTFHALLFLLHFQVEIADYCDSSYQNFVRILCLLCNRILFHSSGKVEVTEFCDIFMLYMCYCRTGNYKGMDGSHRTSPTIDVPHTLLRFTIHTLNDYNILALLISKWDFQH